MSLDHILLGMLDEPASGYDLGREFEASARLFWFAELSQIYPTLKRLESKGFLVSREVPSERGPKRRLYERTPEGQEELHGWLRCRPELATVRLAHVAQLYFLGQLDDVDESIRFVGALRLELEAQLARYRAIEESRRAQCPRDEEISNIDFHEYAALRAGIHVARARLEWCAETLEALERRRRAPDQESEGPSADESTDNPARDAAGHEALGSV